MASSDQSPIKLVKQVLLIRKDLNMSLGKACAQAAHASEQCVRLAVPHHEIIHLWDQYGHGKIVLAAKNLNQLIQTLECARMC